MIFSRVQRAPVSHWGVIRVCAHQRHTAKRPDCGFARAWPNSRVTLDDDGSTNGNHSLLALSPFFVIFLIVLTSGWNALRDFQRALFAECAPKAHRKCIFSQLWARVEIDSFLHVCWSFHAFQFGYSFLSLQINKSAIKDNQFLEENKKNQILTHFCTLSSSDSFGQSQGNNFNLGCACTRRCNHII